MTADKIAIIGMVGRFPGANSMEAFWDVVVRGTETIEDIPLDTVARHIGIRAASHPEYVARAGMVANPLMFDRELFGMSARETELTNPQHRVFLECCHELLERAGALKEAAALRIGIYAGEGFNRYFFKLAESSSHLGEASDLLTLVGNDKDFLATKVSYKLGLTGPSLSIQTACSTSLTAVVMACDALRNYDCDAAIAGGVRIGYPQETGYQYTEGSIMSRSGHCRPFSAAADGTVGGNGVGVVLLKRLEDALQDGDHVHAVIIGYALNNDGNDKAGYFAPSLSGQRAVVFEAHEMADYDPRTLGYVETHGTGTALGDAIELEALAQAFNALGVPTNQCAIGALKANMGHMDAASGVASLMKASLTLEKRMIPPIVGFTNLNPKLAHLGFRFPTQVEEFPLDGDLRRACVSAFGIGGTNAHVVLEESQNVVPEAKPIFSTQPETLLVYSAASEKALEQRKEDLDRLIDARPEATTSLASTLLHTRPVLAVRGRCVHPAGPDPISIKAGSLNKVAFAFSGQGNQYPGMAMHLFNHDSVFRQNLKELCEEIEAESGLDLLPLLTRPGGEAEMNKLSQTYVAQPALFAVEMALARTLAADDVHPNFLLGHSIGEVTAAVLAGVIPEPNAVSLILTRGRLMQSMERGEMLSVLMPAEELIHRLPPGIEVSLINSPESCVVGGQSTIIRTLTKTLRAEGIIAIPLATSHAFHTSFMIEAANIFTSRMADVPLQPPRVPLLSNVTGTWLTDEQATDPDYWGRQIRATVRFSDNLHELSGAEAYLVEIGPGNSIQALSQHIGSRPSSCSGTLPPQQGQQDSASEYLGTLGSLWCQGLPVNLDRHIPRLNNREFLPPYPYQRHEYLPATIDPPAKTDGVTFFESAIVVSNEDFQGPKVPPRWFELPPPSHHTGKVPTEALDDWLAIDTSGELHVWVDLRVWPTTHTPAAAFTELCCVIRHMAASGRLVRVLIITLDEHEQPSSHPISSLVEALGTCLPQEWPNVSIAVRQLAAKATVIFSDLMSVFNPDRAVTARNGKRTMRRRLFPWHPDHDASIQVPDTVLITGGAGALGRQATDLLLRLNPQAKITVCGRRHAAQTDERVTYVAADLSSPSSVETLETALTQQGGADLILHAAGLVGDGTHVPADEITSAVAEQQFAAKVAGTDAVITLAERLRTRRVVLVSSTSATLGGLGLTAYAAANCYLGATARSHDSRHCRWVAVQFDGFSRAPGDSGLSPAEIDKALQTSLSPTCPTEFLTCCPDLMERHRRWVKELQPQADTSPLTMNAEVTGAAVIASALGAESIDPNANFFELGGDSLLAAQVISQVQQRTGVRVSLKAFFQSPTATTLESLIAAGRQESEELTRAPQDFDTPTRLQTKLYLQEMTQAGAMANNLTAYLDFRGEINPQRLKRACDNLAQRHEALRMSFIMDRGQLRSRVADKITTPVTILETPSNEWDDRANQFVSVFDISRPPLFRMLVLYEERKGRLVFDIHHLIADGVTMSLLIRDFCTLYNGGTLPAVNWTATDYAHWQHNSPAPSEAALAFWRTQLTDWHPPTPLPPGTTNGLREDPRTLIVRQEFGSLSDTVEQWVRTEHVTLFHLLFAAQAVLAARRTQQMHVVTGCAFSGRVIAELSDVVSNLIQVHPVSVHLTPDMKLREAVHTTAATLISAAEYQAVDTDPFLPTGSGLTYATLFLMQNTGNKSLSLDGVDILRTRVVPHVATCPLTIQVIEGNTGLVVEVIFARGSYSKTQAELILADYIATIRQIVQHPDFNVCDNFTVDAPAMEFDF